MSEETQTEAGGETEKEAKPAAKKTTRKTTSRKTTASKTTARKAAPKKAAPRKKAAAEPAPEPAVEAPAEAEPAATESSDDAQATNGYGHHGGSHDYTGSQMLEDLKGRNWPEIIKRALLMFLFGVLGSAALWIAFVLAAAQVIFTIFAGTANEDLTRIIKQCGGYVYDVLDYLSFSTDECPFPFGRKIPEGD